ncbi:hypothetical protein [Nocardia sp. N2S4-5]|uniref:hypothetical protein n=1 Tax=Nocardia sp. N2S4-5 TaxID=3351565 RepID=UPI0037D3E356
MAETTAAQMDWRFCAKCKGLFFDGDPSKGICPLGEGHEATGDNFVIPHTVDSTVAKAQIDQFYLGTGGALGPLGEPNGDYVEVNGNLRRNYLFGDIHFSDIDPEPKAQTNYTANVAISALKCFGTDDPSGEDEIFAVISLISLNPNFSGSDQLVKTMRTEIREHVHGKDVIFKSKTVGTVPSVTGSGFKIHVALYDHENGDPNALRTQIQTFLDDAARKGADLVAGAARSGDQRLAGPVGDVTEFEVGGVKPVRLLTFGLAGLLTDWLADDFIAEHEFVVPAAEIISLSDPVNFQKSFRQHRESLGTDVQFNWPPADDQEILFSGAGGSYKIYFTITVAPMPVPIAPKLPTHG